MFIKKKPRFEMSDTSRPQRIYVLESGVGAIRVELSRAGDTQTMTAASEGHHAKKELLG